MYLQGSDTVKSFLVQVAVYYSSYTIENHKKINNEKKDNFCNSNKLFCNGNGV
jgi:hypothetical protein